MVAEGTDSVSVSVRKTVDKLVSSSVVVLVLVAEEVMGSVSVSVQTVKKLVTSTDFVLVLCIWSVAGYDELDGMG